MRDEAKLGLDGSLGDKEIEEMADGDNRQSSTTFGVAMGSGGGSCAPSINNAIRRKLNMSKRSQAGD